LLTWIKTGDKKKFIILKPGEGENPKGGEIIIPNPIYVVDSNVLNYRYAYDKRGIITSRSESVINCKESYIYDPLDRLTYINNQEQQYGISYNGNGNIEQYGRSFYTYGSSKPHAVTSVENNPISCSNSTVTYNFFNQPTHIEENNQQIALYYGANQQRNKTVILTKGETKYTQYRISKYFEAEKKPDSDTTCFYSYIYGDIGVVALNISTFSKQANDSIITHKPELDREKATTVTYDMFYIHTDHLGSYCAITDTGKNVVQRNYFDPWGNYKWIFRSRDGGFSQGNDSLSAQEFAAINFTLTRRGFTGHEHYPQFNIINMNGRLYDPVIGRFFSPDKYVANSSFTQDFNRYTYARNNPLMYTDPSGEWIHFLVGGVMGGLLNWVSHGAEFTLKGFGYFNIGAAAGVLGAGIGAGISSAMAGASFGAGFLGTSAAGVAGSSFIHGAAIGLGSGGSSGFVMGFGNSLLEKNKFGKSLLNGVIGMGIGAGSAALFGGLTGGIDAALDGRSFWDGARVYKSPVGDNFTGTVDGDCVLNALDENSKSYGKDKYDFKYWFEKYGSKRSVFNTDVADLVNSSDIFSSEFLEKTPQNYNDYIDKLTNALSNDQRLMIGNSVQGHLANVSKIRVKLNGTYIIRIAETSPVRQFPYSITSHDEYSFWSFFLRIK